jgi:DNA invertase Pin-like site-specific DNA recombinase
MTNRLFGYARVSTDDQATSADAQAARLKEFAASCGLQLAGLYVDEDVSGALPLKARPNGKRLWDALAPGDTVAFTKVDRCFRSMADAATTLALWKQLGVRVNIIDLGIDVSSPAGELFFNQLASFAAFERQMIGQRIKEALAHRKATGRPYGTSRPLGWVKTGVGKDTRWVPCHDERRLAERVVALREAGGTLAGIARQLARENVTKPGKAKDARVGRYRGCYYLEADVDRLYRAARAGFPIAPRDEIRG